MHGELHGLELALRKYTEASIFFHSMFFVCTGQYCTVGTVLSHDIKRVSDHLAPVVGTSMARQMFAS